MADRRTPARKRRDPQEAERRAAKWLTVGVVLLAALVSFRGRLEPRLEAGRFSAADVLLSGGRLDPNTASEQALAGVPGLGPKQASALVRARSEGAFWRLDDLDRVPGVGPSTLAEMSVWLETGFSGPPPRIDLNRATVGELDALPGIGPALALRIVEHRERHGPFGSASDLDRVSGIGPARVRALRDLVVPR